MLMKQIWINSIFPWLDCKDACNLRITCKTMHDYIKQSAYLTKAMENHFIRLNDVRELSFKGIRDNYYSKVAIDHEEALFENGYINEDCNRLYCKETDEYIFCNNFYIIGSFLDDKWDKLVNFLKTDFHNYHWKFISYPKLEFIRPLLDLDNDATVSFWRGSIIWITTKSSIKKRLKF